MAESTLTRPRLIGLIAAALLLIIAVVYAISQMGGPGGTPAAQQPSQVWYFDLGDNQLFPGDPEALPPIAAPSGGQQESGTPAGVRAHVYACGSCADVGVDDIAFLEQYDPDALDAIRQFMQDYPNRDWNDIPPAGRLSLGFDPNTAVLVASPDLASGWVPRGSEQGAAIMARNMPECPGNQRPRVCLPGMR